MVDAPAAATNGSSFGGVIGSLPALGYCPRILDQRLIGDVTGNAHAMVGVKLEELFTLQTVPRSCKLRTVSGREGPFAMAKSHLKLVAPTEVNRTVAPTRRPNAELRTREHLTPGEVDALVEAAKANRHGHRDATMILLAFRHTSVYSRGDDQPRSRAGRRRRVGLPRKLRSVRPQFRPPQ
jgi:hypothetical protein